MAWKLVISNSHLRVEYVYVKCNQQLTKYKSETQYNNTNCKNQTLGSLENRQFQIILVTKD